MAGSDESNEDLVSGRVNRANDQTTIWAENRYDSTSILGVETGNFRVDFNGRAIFVVDVAKDSEDEGEFRPSEPLDAITGLGWSADHAGKSGGTGVTGIGGKVGGLGVRGEGGQNGTGVLGDAGGSATGVVGLGGPNEGTGVFGLGSGGERLMRRGQGGIGVHGVGGVAHLEPGPDDVMPGVGVFGQGGRITDENRGRLLLGTGVIGVGGDAGNKDLPSHGDAGSAGVFGQGADAKINMSTDGGTTVLDGPAEPGAGVIGIGGVPNTGRLPAAAGVIGLAGRLAKPSIAETGGAGVFGMGSTGVRGIGDAAGQGVSGSSDRGRGGVFASREIAQVRLLPKPVRTRFPEGSTVTPTGISPGAIEEGVVSLPKDGQAGDMMALVDDARMCTLWFCVRGADGGPARWAQVLLGPAFDGQS